MELDSATGLPKLPEGYFWRTQQICEGSTWREYEILIVGPKKQERKVGWWLWKKTVQVEALTAHHSEPIGEQLGENGPYKYHQNLTPVRVRVAANRAYDKWTAKREADEQTAALLGDYPPLSVASE